MKKSVSQCELSRLLKNSQEGNSKAYRQFLDYIKPFIMSVAQKAFLKDDVPDIVQDVFLSIHRSLPSYDPKRLAKPWVMAIAHRRVIDYIRKLESRKKFEALTNEGDVTNLAADTKIDLNEKVQPFLQLVSEDTKEAIILTKLKGYSTEEAAQMMGIKSNALRTKISRGISQIRRRFEEGYLDETD